MSYYYLKEGPRTVLSKGEMFRIARDMQGCSSRPVDAPFYWRMENVNEELQDAILKLQKNMSVDTDEKDSTLLPTFLNKKQ